MIPRPEPSEVDEIKCSRCGRAQSEWRSTEKASDERIAGVFCCEECAHGQECSCDLRQNAPPDPNLKNKIEHL